MHFFLLPGDSLRRGVSDYKTKQMKGETTTRREERRGPPVAVDWLTDRHAKAAVRLKLTQRPTPLDLFRR